MIKVPIGVQAKVLAENKFSDNEYDSVNLTAKILMIGFDEFKGKGGVYTYLLQHKGGKIRAKYYYYNEKQGSLYYKHVLSFIKGDIVSVTGKLKSNYYIDKNTKKINDLGSEIIIETISYNIKYANKVANHLLHNDLTYDVNLIQKASDVDDLSSHEKEFMDMVELMIKDNNYTLEVIEVKEKKQ